MFNKTILTLRRIYSYYPSASIWTSSTLKEEKIQVGKYIINYLKVGRGPHNVLLVPGTLGSIWTAFKPQIDNFDRNKFSLVICDPAGSGKSYLPEEENMGNFFERDAKIAFELMKVLEIPYYSYVGWSSGGSSGLILAATHPETVHKLVVWGSSSHMLQKEVGNYTSLKDLSNWPKPAVEAMTKIYGKETLVKKVNNWVENVQKNYKSFICDHLLEDIKCPTLILYGQKDGMVDSSHVDYLRKHIKNSRVHLYPEGSHNIHIQYADDFNRRVQEFLLQPNDK